jgi:5-methylcytosine-specific restriction endonuclease McrA
MSEITNTKNCAVDVDELIIQETDNFTKILSIDKIKQMGLYWGGNGLGDRLANKKFNYSSIYSSKKTSLYSENDDDSIPPDVLSEFLQTNKYKGKRKGIIGIFVHSIKTNIPPRPINDNIGKHIRSLSCVVCGTQNTYCDHKNDLYNDIRVLNSETQVINDFQPLCNHCNLQKKEVRRKEVRTQKIYSAKNIQRYKVYPFEFPWEKKVFDKNDIYCKNGTYWFDPVEFDRNIYYYSIYVIPIVNEIKYKIKTNKLTLIA